MPNDPNPNIVPLRPDANDLNEAVGEVNETYAVVLAGGKAVILRQTEDAGHGNWLLMPIGSFHTWMANRRVMLGDKSASLSKVWITHAQRKQYEGIVFDPDRDDPRYFNLWHGLAIDPKPGNCDRFLHHIRTSICRKDDDLYRWVIGWAADIVQHPGRKCGTALVLRGLQGTGKTVFGKTIGSLVGPHYLPVADVRYIVGQFNSHLLSCLLLHADESFWAGDHAAEGKLKDLVTGDWHMIELKGIEPIKVRNYVRLLVTTNQEWAIPAGMEERRFAVLEVGERHREDHKYFADIERQLEDGGRAALLDHLLNFDLSQVDLRTIPKTAALLEQKIRSLTPEQAFWLDVLTRGKMPARRDSSAAGGTVYSKADLYDSYIQHANRTGIKRRAIETAIGMFLRKVTPWMKSAQRRTFESEDRTVQGEGLIFPTLETCRAEFTKHLGQAVEWDDRRYWG